MAQFNFSDYQETVAKAQNGQGNSSKVGFFRLKNDGDEAHYLTFQNLAEYSSGVEICIISFRQIRPAIFPRSRLTGTEPFRL